MMPLLSPHRLCGHCCPWQGQPLPMEPPPQAPKLWAKAAHRALTMASSTPTSKPEAQAQTVSGSSAPVPWWQRWSEPVVAVTIIVALVAALTSGGVTAFQSLKGDINSLKGDINSTEARLTETIRLSEMRQDRRLAEVRAELKEVRTELKEDIRAMDDKLDRVLESLLAARP